jgi:putative DNA primase/helicase
VDRSMEMIMQSSSSNSVVAKVPIVGKQQESSLGIVRLEEFLQNKGDVRWLIDGWVQENSLIMVHGPSASGKTFLVLDWCLRLSAIDMENRHWCGRETQSCPVFYLAGEGQQGMRNRISAWGKHHRVNAHNFSLLPKPIDLDQKAVITSLLEDMERTKVRPGLVVIDTLNRYFSGDENSARDARTMIDACSKIMERYGCSVILVHHTGLALDAQHRARGSSAWRGALDIEVSVKPKTARTPMAVIQRKMKDAEEEADKYFELRKVTLDHLDETGREVHSVVLEEVGKPKKTDTKQDRLDASRLRFKNAWLRQKGFDIYGRPYLRRISMIAFLESPSVGMTTKGARRAVQPDSTRLIGILLDAGDIEKFEQGWSVTSKKIQRFMNSETGQKDNWDKTDKTDTSG